MGTVLFQHALRIATMNDRREKIPDGFVLVRENVIEKIGSGNFEGQADRVIEAAGKILLPGFVNCHHHLYQTLTRNLPEVQDVSLFDWLVRLYEVWRELTLEGVYTSTKVGLAELLLSGCTTTSDHLYLVPRGVEAIHDEEIRAAREMGIRFQPTRGSMSRGRSQGGLPPDDVVQGEVEVMRDCERVVSRYHDAAKFSMCRIALAPCSPFSVTIELMKSTIQFARQHGLRVHTHLAETSDEEGYCQKTYSCRPVELMQSLGWLGPDVWFAHCVHLNHAEVDLFARTGTGVAHCPTSNMRLGSGIAPIPELVGGGAPVGLAVDGSASNDTSNFLAEIRQALLLHRLPEARKGRGGVLGNEPVASIPWMSAEDVLWMATRGGARVLGCADEIGSIEEGKAADLVLIDMNQLSFAGAMSDPLAAVVFSQSSNAVHTTMVNGKIVVEAGKILNQDLNALVQSQNRLSAEMLSRSRKKSPESAR
ncbi:MAG: 8-oxoguanine deaminase [Acidobacteriia bacterium]|nr:8-oxoguanine deaminase [Terriglobia bacterium]